MEADKSPPGHGEHREIGAAPLRPAGSGKDASRPLFLALATLALLYAAVVNIRTVVDTDIGWQLAAGRYMVEQREVPRRAVFSYTAAANEWIYPPLAELIFYAAYRLGGFAALTWLGVATCTGTVAVLLRHGGIGTAALAVIAVPAMGYHTLPRAGMFTPLLFASVLSLLWEHHRRGRAALWLLPVLMVAWVNLHVGFIGGIALLAAYAGVELAQALVGSRPAGAASPPWRVPTQPWEAGNKAQVPAAEPLSRLRRAAPWLAVAAAASLLNPWGPRIYLTLALQERILRSVAEQISEWAARVPLSLAGIRGALAWRSPMSAYWWLLAAALVAVVLAARRKQAGTVLLLAAALLAFRHVRFQAVFAAVVVVAAGPLFEPKVQSPKSKMAGFALLGALVFLAGIRVADLVSNRYYLSEGEIAVFGTGASRWYPERACAFLLRERLPGRLFNDYAIGGYLTWRLWPHYPVYIDGRAIPFGADLLLRSGRLLAESPDSMEWQREADRWGIRTVMLGIARYGGVGGALECFCQSHSWRPVYLDEVSAVFVRNREENAPWLSRLQVDCATVRLAPPSTRNKAILHNYYADAGSVFLRLGRTTEAIQAFEQAERLRR